MPDEAAVEVLRVDGLEQGCGVDVGAAEDVGVDLGQDGAHDVLGVAIRAGGFEQGGGNGGGADNARVGRRHVRPGAEQDDGGEDEGEKEKEQRDGVQATGVGEQPRAQVLDRAQVAHGFEGRRHTAGPGGKG